MEEKDAIMRILIANFQKKINLFGLSARMGCIQLSRVIMKVLKDLLCLCVVLAVQLVSLIISEKLYGS